MAKLAEMQSEITVSKEDYLKAILEADSEGRTVIPALLAQWIGVSAPAVTKAVKRLREDGYLEANREGTLKLTAKGRDTAHHTALRHHLVERMLSEMFGMEWHQVHAEAERLEHAISPAFEEKLMEKLGEGDCPHGNRVLPESPAQIRKRGLIPLSEADPHKSYVVVSLYERDSKLLEFLHKMGIGPQVLLQVQEKNYDETMKVKTADRAVTLGHSATSRVWVRPEASSKPRKAPTR
jgi:DtxR family Mn-dependent transcriptional regulator